MQVTDARIKYNLDPSLSWDSDAGRFALAQIAEAHSRGDKQIAARVEQDFRASG